MKLVRYILHQASGDQAKEESEYLISDAEFLAANEKWNARKAYYCDRLDVLLPSPRIPVDTPLRYQRFDLFGDPATHKEYVKADDGKFYGVGFSRYDPQPSKSDIASPEIEARLVSVEDYPKIGKKKVFL